jgi:L-alanine-DL-glutamate epimerase-like enolase superfamily enzyme
MSQIDRRTLLGGLPLAASAALPQTSAAPQRAGQLKITKLVYYRSSIRWRDLLFVEVHTDGGIIGLGEGTCHGRVDVVEAALRWLEPYVIGMDPVGPEKQWERIAYRLTRWSSGIIPRTALSALDIAFWDIEGKRLGVPVWRLLGGSIHPRFCNYHTHWDAVVQSANPEAFAERAVENFLIHKWEGADDKLFQEATNGTYPVQKEGYLTLPDKPGLGIEFDAAQLAKRYPFTNLGSQVEQRGRF